MIAKQFFKLELENIEKAERELFRFLCLMKNVELFYNNASNDNIASGCNSNHIISFCKASNIDSFYI